MTDRRGTTEAALDARGEATLARLADVVSPRPMLAELPAVYRDDAFLAGLTAALDEVLAPVLLTLDCLEAYVDPRLAPPDFLHWLCDWLDLGDDEHWGDERRRRFVAEAGSLFKERGTEEGLRRLLRLAFDVEVDLDESGGSVGSSAAQQRAAAPGSFPPWVRVRVPHGVAARLDARVRREVAAFAVPAHVDFVVEVLVGPARPPREVTE